MGQGIDSITLAVTLGEADEYSACASLRVHGVISELPVGTVLTCISSGLHLSDRRQSGSHRPLDKACCTCVFSLEDFQSKGVVRRIGACVQIACQWGQDKSVNGELTL